MRRPPSAATPVARHPREQEVDVGGPHDLVVLVPGHRLEPLVRHLGDHVLEQLAGHLRRELGVGVGHARQVGREHVVGDVVRLRGEPVRGADAVRDQAWWKYRQAPWSIAHSSPCQTSRFGFRQQRSTFAVSASSQMIRAATSGSGVHAGVEPERARQEVHAQVQPDARVEQVLHLLVRLVAADRRVELDGDQVGGAIPSRRASSPTIDLGDQHPRALAGAAELADVGAQVVGLDDARAATRPRAAARRSGWRRRWGSPDQPTRAHASKPSAVSRAAAPRRRSPGPARSSAIRVSVSSTAARRPSCGTTCGRSARRSHGAAVVLMRSSATS